MQLVRVKEGYEEAGKIGYIIGKEVSFEQRWTPVKWDDEDDPDWFKSVGLEHIK